MKELYNFLSECMLRLVELKHLFIFFVKFVMYFYGLDSQVIRQNQIILSVNVQTLNSRYLSPYNY
jgi:hypothetical protein